MSQVIDIDKGYKRIRDEVYRMALSYTKIGVQAGKKRSAKKGEPDPPLMAVIAFANEFGVPEKNIPARSFLRSSYDKMLPTVKKLFEQETSKIITGHSTTKRSLAAIGEFAKVQIKNKISSNIPPLNAPSTAKRKLALSRKAKGAKFIGPLNIKTLIDSGQLLRSIQHREWIRDKPEALEKAEAE